MIIFPSRSTEQACESGPEASPASVQGQRLQADGIELDPVSGTVSRDGNPIRLTPKNAPCWRR